MKNSVNERYVTDRQTEKYRKHGARGSMWYWFDVNQSTFHEAMHKKRVLHYTSQ